ncbi:hypothetical protein [Streptomyces niveus]|uniref:hypothetical protein n=1 Tax=Streptomyces niveus TaxID=193462 RepID=UPI0034463421
MVTPGAKLTSVQRALALRDVRDDGAGSTLQALQRYGLIEVRDEVAEGPRGKSRTVEVKLTRAGRAAVRAGVRVGAPGPAVKGGPGHGTRLGPQHVRGAHRPPVPAVRRGQAR